MANYPVLDGAGATIIANEKDPAYDVDANYPVLDGAGGEIVHRKYDERIDYGPNIARLGSDWTQGTGWAATDDQAVATGVTSDGLYLEKNVGLEAGKTYEYSFTLAGTVGGTNYLAFRFGGGSDNFNVTSAGAKTGTVVASGSGNLRIRSGASVSDLTLSGLVVREVL